MVNVIMLQGQLTFNQALVKTFLGIKSLSTTICNILTKTNLSN